MSLHPNAFEIINSMFESANKLQHVHIPLSTPSKELKEIVNHILLKNFNDLQRNKSYMTVELYKFCHDTLKGNDDLEEDENDPGVSFIFRSDVLACSDILYPTSKPKLPEQSDVHLHADTNIWYEIKSTKRLGYVCIDPIKVGFYIIQTSSLSKEMIKSLRDNVSDIITFCNIITDKLLANEADVVTEVSNILSKIMEY